MSRGGTEAGRSEAALAWTEAVKAALRSLGRHSSGDQPDIFLFATRRGGSTWLMEVIAANPGIGSVNQPLSIYSASRAQLRRLPVREYGELVELDTEVEERVPDLVDSYRRGRLRFGMPWRFWRGHSLRTDRLVFKILTAKALIEWFGDRFGGHVLYLTRHPIPVALSIIRNGWGLTSDAYLNSDRFVSLYLKENAGYCHDVRKHGSLLEQHVLNWVLENLVPLRGLPQHPEWTHVTYEAAMLDPEKTLEGLADRLALPAPERMIRRAGRPSVSTRRSSTVATRRAIKRADDDSARARLLQRWRHQVPSEQERSAMLILERLEVDLYRVGDWLPATTSLAPGSS